MTRRTATRPAPNYGLTVRWDSMDGPREALTHAEQACQTGSYEDDLGRMLVGLDIARVAIEARRQPGCVTPLHPLRLRHGSGTRTAYIEGIQRVPEPTIATDDRKWKVYLYKKGADGMHRRTALFCKHNHPRQELADRCCQKMKKQNGGDWRSCAVDDDSPRAA